MHGGYLELPMERILTIFDLQVAAIHPTKFRLDCPFDSRKYV